MTAVFEHAIQTLNPPQSPQSQQNVIEIIDLSSPEIPSQNHRTSPQQRMNNLAGPSREVISLLDSDDEDEDEPIIVGSFGGNNVLRDSRNRIFSPPPPPLDGTIPPVPPVPSRYAEFTAFPVRRRAAAAAAGPSGSSSSGVIRPRSQPLPFEIHAVEEGASTSVPDPRRLPSPLRAAPPSHHLPAMGFGGALLSTHTTRTNTNTTRPRHPLSNRVARTSRHSFLSRAYQGILSLFGDEDAHDERSGPWWDGDNFTPPQIQLFWAPTTETEDYLPRYTHPSKPEPGFTFDFGAPTGDSDSKFPPTSIDEPIILDDDDDDDDSKPSQSTSAAGPSSTASEPAKLTAVLLCARCQSPLLLNAGLSSEAKDRRVWALRCGHLIDERCLAEIGQPSEYFTNSSGSNDRKGKGKAPPPPPSPRPYAIALSDTSDTTMAQPEAQHLEVPGNIRSRLRSRTAAPGGAAPGPHSPVPRTATRSGGGAPSQPPPAKKRRVGANKKSKIQGRHEWTCPVQGCALVHASIKVDDVWGPEKEQVVGREKRDGRGAIPIFT